MQVVGATLAVALVEVSHKKIAMSQVLRYCPGRGHQETHTENNAPLSSERGQG